MEPTNNNGVFGAIALDRAAVNNAPGERRAIPARPRDWTRRVVLQEDGRPLMYEEPAR